MSSHLENAETKIKLDLLEDLIADLTYKYGALLDSLDPCRCGHSWNHHSVLFGVNDEGRSCREDDCTCMEWTEHPIPDFRGY